ncbi:MAG: acyl-CoA thioesterase [Actinomycetes bacterium]
MTDDALVPPQQRPDARRQELGRYPFTVELQTRWGDMDALHHLNNSALARYYEEARIRFLAHAQEGVPEPLRLMVGSLRLDYLRQAHHPAPILAGVGIAGVGGASIRLLQALFQQGACVGLADVTLVCTSADRSGPERVPDDWRARFDELAMRRPTAP